MCPTNKAIYSTQLVTCESSLYFQTADNYNLCQRKLLLYYRTPILQHHSSVWVYHFPECQQVTLCYRRNDAWTSHMIILFRSSILHNVSRCPLTADLFQTLPELLGDTQATLDATHVYVPDKISVIASHELQTLEEMMPSEIGRLDEIKHKPRHLTK